MVNLHYLLKALWILIKPKLNLNDDNDEDDDEEEKGGGVLLKVKKTKY